MSDTDRATKPPAEPPGEGESIEDAAREAIEEMEKSETPTAGRGDYG